MLDVLRITSRSKCGRCISLLLFIHPLANNWMYMYYINVCNIPTSVYPAVHANMFYLDENISC